MLASLVLSIKRYTFRANDSRAAAADAEYRALRPRVLEQQGYRCAFCRLVSKFQRGANKAATNNEVHHVGKHDDNRYEMLKVACILCHAYHHVGETTKTGDVQAETLGGKSLIAYVPELSAVDVNNLQRVMGIALRDPDEKSVAEEIADHLIKRALPVKDVWGSFYPLDFAAAMSHLDDAEYESRAEPLEDLRLVFNFAFLKDLAARLQEETRWQVLPVSSWSSVARNHVGHSQ
ncbi:MULTISPECIES: hypothetical protein [unclassified Burkholderia]|uniref:hypothetical protein n=1 Tax=unclassified Burkholderia TaxID=2613784 RepID=UPI002AB2CAD1|nr:MULTISPECIES: hypothetical protein [unclassified Burkholderia]